MYAIFASAPPSSRPVCSSFFCSPLRSVPLLVFRVIFSESPINSVLFITRENAKDGDRERERTLLRYAKFARPLAFATDNRALLSSSTSSRCTVAPCRRRPFFIRNPIYCKHKMCFSIDTNYKLPESLFFCIFSSFLLDFFCPSRDGMHLAVIICVIVVVMFVFIDREWNISYYVLLSKKKGTIKN